MTDRPPPVRDAAAYVRCAVLAEMLLRDFGLVAAMPAEALAEAVRKIGE